MLMMIAMAVGMMLLLGIGYVAFSGPNPQKVMKRRLAAARERHVEDAATQAATQMQIRKMMKQNRMESVAGRLIPRPDMMAKRLERTGKNITLGRYAIINMAIVAVLGFVLTMRGFPLPLSILLGMFVGIGVPHFVIGVLIKKRLDKFVQSFPDAIELMVRGLRSGLPITETIGIVAKEIQGPVAVEFKLVAERMKIGTTMDAAMSEVAERIAMAEFQFFVITLNIQRETGGNLAETLSNLADVLRKRAQMKLKIRAMSSESKASAMIIGALPFIVFGLVSLINPGYMAGFFSDERLIIAGLGGMVWMSIGVFIMSRMINFEI